MHRTKSILAALAAVALSATAVFAAGGLKSPDAAGDGPARAALASGKTVTVRADGPDPTAGTRSPEATETPEADETPEANETPDAAKSPEANQTPEANETPKVTKSPKATTSPSVDATTGTTNPHPDNHGKTVSEAAHASTPSGFDNHGAYVSSIARKNHGHGTPPVTPGTPPATTPTH